jgi:hypothetical protein
MEPNLPFLKRLIKLTKVLIRLTKGKGEKTQITKLRNGSGCNAINFIEVK